MHPGFAVAKGLERRNLRLLGYVGSGTVGFGLGTVRFLALLGLRYLTTVSKPKYPARRMYFGRD